MASTPYALVQAVPEGREFFGEGFATGNDAIVDEICAPDLVERGGRGFRDQRTA